MRAALRNQRAIKEKVAETLYSQAPNQDSRFCVRPFGNVEDQQIRYFVYADVLEELVKAAHFRKESATALLLGQFCMDETGPFIEITAFRDLEYLYDEDPVETMQPLVKEVIEELHDKADDDDRFHIVGVFLAQPGSEAELDSEAARLHLSAFNMPFQVMAIVDGVNDQFGLYARSGREGFFNAAFHLVEGVESENDKIDEVTEPTESTAMEMMNDDDRNRRACSEGNSR